jgi:hypothetical protein
MNSALAVTGALREQNLLIFDNLLMGSMFDGTRYGFD